MNAKSTMHMFVCVTVCVLLTLLFGPTRSASSQDVDKDKRNVTRVVEPRAYITQRRPKRVEGTLRYANISDVEMRQITQIANKKHPGAILNVSGVTVGCPCEDGPTCADQVWVVAHKDARTKGLMLSNIDSTWQIGPVQKWWLRRDRLDAEFNRSFIKDPTARRENRSKYYDAFNRLLMEFPKCKPPPLEANRDN